MRKKNFISNKLKKNLRTFFRNRLAIFGLVFVLLMLFLAVFAKIITKYDPSMVDLVNMNQAPDAAHIFGTDNLGRDIFANVIYGARMSMLLGFAGSFFASVIGLIMGSVSGYFGGKTDAFMLRVSEVFQTIPQLLFILVLVAMFGRSVQNMILVFAITGWPRVYRIIRNEFLLHREETYVEVCRAFGFKKRRIIFREVLPNTIAPFSVAATVNVSIYILTEAGLSYLGFGLSTTVPTWGNILNASKTVEIVANYWWIWALPGAVLCLFVLAVNFLGDGLRDVVDPKQQ